MCLFIDNSVVPYQLEKIINEAKHRLILISQQQNISLPIKRLIEANTLKELKISFVFSGSEIDPKLQEWIQSLPFSRSYCINESLTNLYLNDAQCLMTSLGLNYSLIHSSQCTGVIMDIYEDDASYEKAYQYALRLISRCHSTQIAQKIPVKKQIINHTRLKKLYGYT